jgi:hypothetical protein
VLAAAARDARVLATHDQATMPVDDDEAIRGEQIIVTALVDDSNANFLLDGGVQIRVLDGLGPSPLVRLHCSRTSHHAPTRPGAREKESAAPIR